MDTGVVDYPEAQSKYDTYEKVVEDLLEYQKTINEAISLKNLNNSDIIDLYRKIKGVYYDEYFVKAGEYLVEMNSMLQDFNSFNLLLVNRITNAEKLRDMWKERINMGYYEDA